MFNFPVYPFRCSFNSCLWTANIHQHVLCCFILISHLLKCFLMWSGSNFLLLLWFIGGWQTVYWCFTDTTQSEVWIKMSPPKTLPPSITTLFSWETKWKIHKHFCYWGHCAWVHIFSLNTLRYLAHLPTYTISPTVLCIPHNHPPFSFD